MTHHTSTLLKDGFPILMASGPKPGQEDVQRQDPKSDAQQHQQKPQPSGANPKSGAKPTLRGPRK